MFKNRFRVAYANNNDALVPEFWAMEGVSILRENSVMAGLVHRDFEPIIANYGDIVNTRKPAEMTASRKTDDDEVTEQDVSSTNIQVPMNQHVYVSFIIKDGERSKAFKDLVSYYLEPAMIAQSRFLDLCLLGQVHQYLANNGGLLGAGTSSNINDYIVDTREVMNTNKCPEGRNLVITTGVEALLLKNSLNVEAYKAGDGGAALREAYLGRKYGFDLFMCQNAPYINYLDTGTTALNDAGMVLGDTVVTAASSHGIVTGCYIMIAGEGQPQLVTGVSTNDITISPGLTKRVPASNAVVTRYMPALVDLSAGYAAGYAKEITVDAFSATAALGPKVGQIVRFGSDGSTISGTSAVYTIVKVSAGTDDGASGLQYDITLDRPLDAAITNNSLVAVGPSGHYNFAFHRNALSLVNRPLALPEPGAGALSGVAVDRDMSMRVTIQYDGKKQGHRVTLDSLFGLAVLDRNKGAVMFA